MIERVEPTFRLERVDDFMTIVCLLCGSQSAHPKDIDEGYCARCHLFHEVVMGARALSAAQPTTHDCYDWMTALGECAVCGAVLSRSLNYLRKGQNESTP